MKRITLDVFMDDADFTTTFKNYLDKFKDKAKLESSISYHDCGHDDASKCENVVKVL